MAQWSWKLISSQEWGISRVILVLKFRSIYNLPRLKTIISGCSILLSNMVANIKAINPEINLKKRILSFLSSYHIWLDNNRAVTWRVSSVRKSHMILQSGRPNTTLCLSSSYICIYLVLSHFFMTDSRWFWIFFRISGRKFCSWFYTYEIEIRKIL